MKHIKAFNEGFKTVKQPQVYLIDKNTKEYLGTFRNILRIFVKQLRKTLIYK